MLSGASYADCGLQQSHSPVSPSQHTAKTRPGFYLLTRRPLTGLQCNSSKQFHETRFCFTRTFSICYRVIIHMPVVVSGFRILSRSSEPYRQLTVMGNPNVDWDLNRDLNRFSDSTCSNSIWIVAIRFAIRLKNSRFDIKRFKSRHYHLLTEFSNCAK